jgi:hypothetical protein
MTAPRTPTDDALGLTAPALTLDQHSFLEVAARSVRRQGWRVTVELDQEIAEEVIYVSAPDGLVRWALCRTLDGGAIVLTEFPRGAVIHGNERILRFLSDALGVITAAAASFSRRGRG